MKILFATDLHGQSRKYKKLIELCKEYIGLLICGADILPYTKQKEFIDNYLPEFFSKIKCPIIIDFGNDDRLVYYNDFKKVIEKFSHVYYTHLQEAIIGNISFIGMNYVTDYPFGLKDWCRKDGMRVSDPYQMSIPLLSEKGNYKNIRKEKYHIFYVIDNLDDYLNTMESLDEVLSKLPKPKCKKVIYLFHSPPVNLKLDVCADFREVGCKAITNFIIDENPLATLHGHIHENYYKTDVFYNKLNKSICIQPGQSGGHKTLVYCTFNTKDIEKTIKRFEIKC